MKSLMIFLVPLLLYAEDWEARFKDVCQRDTFCPRLKGSDGSWLKPKPEIIALLKDVTVQTEIKNAAARYGVDPTAVAGAIVAENSLNVGVKDSVQTWLAGKMGITSIGGKSFSFGLGQIQLQAARDAENYVASLENRKPRTDAELTQEVADPMGSIRTAAAIIRKVQDDYKKEGFDISKDPGVLSTLYNLGHSEKKAKEAKAQGRLPQVNYFGLFVEKYSTDIRTATKIGLKPTPTVAKIAIPVVAGVADQKAEKPSLNEAKTEKQNKNLIKADYVSKSVPLVAAPMLCDSTTYGQDVVAETKSQSFGAPVGVLAQDETFTEVSRSLDCKSNPWKLVKGVNGAAGWIQDDQLEKVKATRLDPKKTCSSGKTDAACRKNLEKAVGDLAVSTKSSDGLLYIKPVTASKGPNDQEATFTMEDSSCGYQPSNMGGANAAYFGPAQSAWRQFSKSELESSAREDISFFNKELERMSKEVGLPVDQLREPENPYAEIATQLVNMRERSQVCLRTLKAEIITCGGGSPKAFKVAIGNIHYQKDPEYSEITSQLSPLLSSLSSSYWYQTPYFAYSAEESEVKTSTPAEIKESISECKERWEELQKKLGVGSSLNQLKAYYLVTMDRAFEASEKATDQQMKDFAGDFITFAKFCHGRLNVLETSKTKNRFSCTQAPQYLASNSMAVSKEIIAKLYQQNPSQLLVDMESGVSSILPLRIVTAIAPTNVPTAQVPNAPGAVNLGKRPYCPNRTAEFIEDLVKNNPCIKRVYVPTRFLSNRLSDLGSRAIYRQFEKDGNYAVEMGDGVCK